MKFKFMLPYQLREALEKNVPALLPIGVLEYHSEHLPFGVDGLNVEGPLDLLEERHPEVVIFPPFYYGCASNAVAGQDKGTIDIDSRRVSELAECLFMNLLEIGFRNIHGFIAHQTENFEQGMPTDLAFRFAGRRAIFTYLEKHRGAGWWGNREMCEYYKKETNIFDSIQIHGLSCGISKVFPGDHAGKSETSKMMELYPETVHMERHTGEDWFAESALDASREYGHAAVTSAVDYWEKQLFGNV